MPALPVLTAKQVIRAPERGGFYIHHQKGSHVHLRHTGKQDVRVVVPFHNRELAIKTLRTIISQSGLSTDEFINLI